MLGKTSLLISFAENKFPEDYVPTVFEVSSRENYSVFRNYCKDHRARGD